MPRRRYCLHEPVLSAHAQIALVEADLPEAVAADSDYALSAAQVRRHAPGPVPLVEGCGERILVSPRHAEPDSTSLSASSLDQYDGKRSGEVFDRSNSSSYRNYQT